jgi:aminoglycoside phosphotransferase (APT) family kinase protein
MPRFLTRRPPSQTLAWAAASIGDGAQVTSMRRLRGGMSSSMTALTIEDARGHRHRLVLRRFVRAEWLAEEPDLARHEASALTLLERSEVPAPRLVAFDEHGTRTDVPAVLMTRLKGRIELDPPDLASYLRAQAEILPRIHAIRAGARDAIPAYFRYYPSPAVPAGTRHPEVWRTLTAHASNHPPEGPATFIHRDYHPANVLWSRGRLTGVVDWVNACLGPPEVDVGHARWNLAQLVGVEAADAFLGAWLAAAGRSQHDPYWDVVSLLDAGDSYGSIEGAVTGWQDAGRTDLTVEVAQLRRDEYALSLVRRL